MKKFIYPVLIVLSGVFGYFIHDIDMDFRTHEEKVESYQYNVNVCNNTQTDFRNVDLFSGNSLGDIKAGTCSGYIKLQELYSYRSMIIYTLENGVAHTYSMMYTDNVGEELLEEGKHTININSLDRDSLTVTQHEGAIEYEITGVEE